MKTMALSRVDERNELPNANVIARLELQQGDSREAECTPNSPAACRAAIVHTLQCGIDDGANSSSLSPLTGMSAAQGTRRSTPAALGVCGALEPSYNRPQACGSTSARPRRAHRGLLRDVTTMPCSSIFALDCRIGNATSIPACRRRCMCNLVAALLSCCMALSRAFSNCLITHAC